MKCSKNLRFACGEMGGVVDAGSSRRSTGAKIDAINKLKYQQPIANETGSKILTEAFRLILVARRSANVMQASGQRYPNLLATAYT